MRVFTFVVSVIFVTIGVVMIRDGDKDGWLVGGFFAACLLVAVFEPYLPKPWLKPEYKLVITADDVACEHHRRPREVIRWADVHRIWYVTTNYGPRVPDEWILLEGSSGGCSFPTEAEEMDKVWDEFERRFPGFDYAPIIAGPRAGAAKHLCWERASG